MKNSGVLGVTQSLLTAHQCALGAALVYFYFGLFVRCVLPASSAARFRTGSRKLSSRASTFNCSSCYSMKAQICAEASHPRQGEELRLKSWQGKTLVQGQKDHPEIFIKHKMNL